MHEPTDIFYMGSLQERLDLPWRPYNLLHEVMTLMRTVLAVVVMMTGIFKRSYCQLCE